MAGAMPRSFGGAPAAGAVALAQDVHRERARLAAGRSWRNRRGRLAAVRSRALIIYFVCSHRC